MAIERESDLYTPVKAHLEALGYEVRGEVGKCDVAAVRDGAIVGVELKLSFGLPVIYQALERLPSFDLVYVAVAVPDGKVARRNWDAQVPDAVRLCRMLGVGLLSVRDGLVVVHADPGPYQPRRSAKGRARLLSEFTRRSGDHNLGGTTKRPRVTAYREEALSCAEAIAAAGPMSPKALREATGIPEAAKYLQGNPYGWFERVDRGVYAVTPSGRAAMVQYADVLAARARLRRAAAPAALAA